MIRTTWITSAVIVPSSHQTPNHYFYNSQGQASASPSEKETHNLQMIGDEDPAGEGYSVLRDLSPENCALAFLG